MSDTYTIEIENGTVNIAELKAEDLEDIKVLIERIYSSKDFANDNYKIIKSTLAAFIVFMDIKNEELRPFNPKIDCLH